MEVDRNVLTEALSVWLGLPVKYQSECLNLDSAIKLQITGLTAAALLGYEACTVASAPVSHLTSLVARWFLGDGGKSQETPKLESASSSLRKQIFVIPDDFFDPLYDFDFTYMSESTSDSGCARGDEPYKRPYGWKRFALKVRDKYPDGNTWLGTGGWRSHSAPGGWPVSYHGTSLQGAVGIIQSHYKPGNGSAYGRGIYSSPDIKVADGYATCKKFTSQKNGKTYKVIMQNRVNPKKREIKNKDIWLVPILEGTSAEKEKEIVESSIRPYGLLLKEV